MWLLVSLYTATGVTGAGVLPRPTAPVTSTAPSACVPALGVVTPTGVASATGSPGRHERARESSRSERLSGARLVGRGPILVGRVAGVGPLPLLALPVSVRASASSSSASSDTEERVSAMPPPLLDVLV